MKNNFKGINIKKEKLFNKIILFIFILLIIGVLVSSLISNAKLNNNMANMCKAKGYNQVTDYEFYCDGYNDTAKLSGVCFSGESYLYIECDYNKTFKLPRIIKFENVCDKWGNCDSYKRIDKGYFN